MHRGGVKKGLGWGGRVGLRNFLGYFKDRGFPGNYLESSGLIRELQCMHTCKMDTRIHIVLYSNTVYFGKTYQNLYIRTVRMNAILRSC